MGLNGPPEGREGFDERGGAAVSDLGFDGLGGKVGGAIRCRRMGWGGRGDEQSVSPPNIRDSPAWGRFLR
ncbi:hypothetical protein TIFTF001_056056 [Ficus carica]|uniref:Uncharacterized protein n=1 Tax=Ficus carica TaxID=3494 RepID=A0AA88JFZ8_FICCA|nr:hypothetical protein TIFTF001_056056 [Ficus carica]